MKVGTQADVEGYLNSAAYNLLNAEHGFVVANKPTLGGDRDTLLVCIPAHMFPGRSFAQFEPALVDKLEEQLPKYPAARYTILVESLEGISRTFLDICSARDIKIRVPVQFFDAPFKVEESPDASSAIRALRDPSILTKRVPQPFVRQNNEGTAIEGDDLLLDLRKEFDVAESPCVRFVIGSAGAGKTILFRSLFAILFRDFIDSKVRLNLSRRPIPFIPEHLRATYTIRTFALVESFLRSDVAAPVSRDTLEWMLVKSCCVWLFDGLDELYSGDPEFFPYLLELLTRPGSRAQVLICARDSLLSSNDEFVQFVRSFSPKTDPSIKIYQLKDWDRTSKRHFAWIGLVGHSPQVDTDDPSSVTNFLTKINLSPTTRTLSGLPFYCSLLLERFSEMHPIQFKNEFDLLEAVVQAILAREIGKGVILPDAFEQGGLDDYLEAIASDFCATNYTGSSTDDIRVYSEMVLRSALTEDERRKFVTSLMQFPLFAAADRPGLVSFKHELLAEFLFGRHIVKAIKRDPITGIKKLAARPRPWDTLAFRYVVSRLSSDSFLRESLVAALIHGSSDERTFKTLLQAWISSAEGHTKMLRNVSLEGRDLSGMKFTKIDLSDISFRNTVLTDVSFSNCLLRASKFEGARLVGTRFNLLDSEALRGAHFGNLEHFDYIYSGPRLLEDRDLMKEWTAQQTGIRERHSDPCPTALQLRGLFRKFVHEDGTVRRGDLALHTLSRGTIYPNAPKPSTCITVCIRHGFLGAPNFRDRVRRPTGNQYDEIVSFMKDWTLGDKLKVMMDELCPANSCSHGPSPMHEDDRIGVRPSK